MDFTEIAELLTSSKSGVDLSSKVQLNRIDIMLSAITKHLQLDVNFDQAGIKGIPQHLTPLIA